MQSIDKLLMKLVERGGSDLHLMAGMAPAIRLHGEIVPLDEPMPTSDQMEKAIFDLLTPAQIRDFRESPTTRGELDFGYGMRGVGRFRVNVHYQRGSVAAVIRAVANEIPRLESLNLPATIAELTTANRGLILVTGPTGSGKSTTLASMIDRINETRKGHIITIEDPVEYLHRSKSSYVTQRDVGEGSDTQSFRNALKYALRQDPDVILVGEMRDYETIGIALTAAETGHVVFGTLHTSSAAQTISRIIDVFPADRQQQVATQLSATLVAVVAQILLPRADGKGRIPAVEIMRGNPAIRALIRENKVASINQVIESSLSSGMMAMDRSLLQLVEQNLITAEVALMHATKEYTIKQLSRFQQAA